MKLENSFTVTARPEDAWELLMDVRRVIPCMPGAELVEEIDESTWKARMRVKLGPISLSFLSDVRRESVDHAARSVHVVANAREERGRGAANVTIDSTLAAEDGRTRVTVATDLRLSGPAAQYGRGLVQGVTEQILKDFAACLEQQLAPAAGEAPAAAAAAPAPQRPISGLAVGFATLRAALARLWRRVARRR